MNVLVVEDEIKINRGLVALIQMYQPSCAVYQAKNGNEALALSEKVFFDIIFTDIKMPGMSGLEMLEKLEYKSKQIVVITGYADFEFAQKSIVFGVLEYILKPVDPQKIKNVLNVAIQKQRSMKNACLSNLVNNFEEMNEKAIANGKKKLDLKRKNLICITRGKNPQVDMKKEIYQICSEVETSVTKEYNVMYYSMNKVFVMMFSFDDESVQNHIMNILISHKNNIEMLTSNSPSNIKSIRNVISSGVKNYTVETPQTQTEEKRTDINIINIIKQYIEENLSQNISLSDLAEISYMHPTYVSRLFKKETGVNLSDYIVEIRIAKAKEMLLDPKYKIYQIAEATGFNNSKYFGNVFKSVTGITPTEYRNNQ